MTTARVKGLTPAISSQRSWSVAGPSAGDEAERAADHILDLDAGERLALVEGGGEQYRKRGFVELDALPVGRAAEPLVLMPVAVRQLRRHQIAQGVARLLIGAERQKCAGGLDQIARPDQMVAAALVAAVAPRDAETGDHRAGKGLVEMAAQHDRRDQELVRQRRRHIERHRVALAALGLPLPATTRCAAAGDCRRAATGCRSPGSPPLRRCCRNRATAPRGAAVRRSTRHCPVRPSHIPRSSRRCGRNPASRRWSPT